MTPRSTRAERLAMPLARAVVRELAVTHGGCVRPVQLRRTDTETGQVDQVLVPCGHTLASVCPPCAERAKAQAAGQDTGELDAVNTELDELITRSGVRGKVIPATTARRHRSTRR